jgi:hypothetical protein
MQRVYDLLIKQKKDTGGRHQAANQLSMPNSGSNQARGMTFTN